MTRQLPRAKVENTIEIIEYVKDKELTVRTKSGPTPFVYRYHFEPDEGRTTLSLLGQGDLGGTNGIASIAPNFLLAGFVKRGVETNLRKLKGLLEGREN